MGPGGLEEFRSGNGPLQQVDPEVFVPLALQVIGLFGGFLILQGLSLHLFVELGEGVGFPGPQGGTDRQDQVVVEVVADLEIVGDDGL